MDERIARTIEHIKINLDKKITLKYLSEIACMSPNYFHRYFKKSTGLTPFQFVELHKSKEAYKLLTESKISVQDIAILLGYNNYETFSRFFKKYNKIAPDDLRSVILNVTGDLNLEDAVIIPIISNQADENELISKLRDALSSEELIPVDHYDLKASVALCNKSNDNKHLGNGIRKYIISYDDTLSKRLQKRVNTLI